MFSGRRHAQPKADAGHAQRAPASAGANVAHRRYSGRAKEVSGLRRPKQ
jgi:hypothetical protein